MKRALQVVSAALLLTIASVTAQAQGGGRGGAAQREAMFKDITLTPAQTASIDSLYKVASGKTAELRKDVQQGTPPSDELRAKMTAVTSDRNSAIKKVLTVDQVVVFDKNVAALPAGRGRGGR